MPAATRAPYLPVGLRRLAMATFATIAAIAACADGGDEPAPDSVRGYPPEIREIRYPVPEDGSEQPALYWAPELEQGRRVPLLVALHTWGGGHRQAGGEADYAKWCLEQGWIFLHPDFRGPNRRPEAMGSDLVVADIRAAVAWAQAVAPVDEDRVYAVGASGGGHASLLVAGRLPELWAGVSAWCGISDIAAWHRETRAAGRENYAKDIEQALGAAPEPGTEAFAAAAHRSPLRWLANATGVPLDINHGLADGRSGSVPFTHSLHAWNAVVPESERFAAADIAAWYADPATLPRDPSLVDPLYTDRPVVFRRTHRNTRLTLFDGGHEIHRGAALNWLAAQRRGRPAEWTAPKVGDLRSTDAARESGK